MAQEQQQIGINLDAYAEGKSKGTIRVVLVNGMPQYTVRQFDPNTGEPKGVLLPLDRKAVAKQIEDMEADIAKAKVLLADIDAAKEVMPS